MDWYTTVLKSYATFSGRARRTEYWMFTLINVIVTGILYGIGMAFSGGAIGTLFTVAYWVYALAVLIPSVAVLFRRLHDTNRSGWWWLIGLVPIVGAIVLIVFLATEGTAGDNTFGTDPKSAERGAPAVA
jgi:uncharacterized membrane protein YhaH (DUF805 family)